MPKIKKILLNLPEYYLVVLAILAAYTPPFSFIPILMVLAALLILQIVFQHKVTGLFIASIFLLTNLYMLAALISEFNEFPTFSSGAQELLFGGLSLWCVNVLAGLVMIYKYVKADRVVGPHPGMPTTGGMSS